MTHPEFTLRQRQVLMDLAWNGGTNAQIGARLGIGPATVRSHLDSIRVRTGVHTRAGLVAWAWRNGWMVAV